MQTAGFPLFDTHCHLDDEKFADDLPSVLERYFTHPDSKLIAVSTGILSALACRKIAESNPSVFYAAGLHPNSIAENPSDSLNLLTEILKSGTAIAVGEMGLDSFRDFTPMNVQVEFFKAQIKLARRFNLPVIIHCREAWEPLFEILAEDVRINGKIPGVLHSFTGGIKEWKTCLNFGLHISFAGMITYKKNEMLREIAKAVPLDRIITETDAPYLSPEPFRGKRNEPQNVLKTVECLAMTRGVESGVMAKQLWNNAFELFLKPMHSKGIQSQNL